MKQVHALLVLTFCSWLTQLATAQDTEQCVGCTEKLRCFRRGIYQRTGNHVLVLSAGPLRSIEHHLHSFLVLLVARTSR
jgi:hypothetical protein